MESYKNEIKMIDSYKCNTAIALIIFNRIEETKKLINAVSKVTPSNIYIISDGPRENNFDDIEKVKYCRNIVEQIDWECNVVKIYSETNMGCMKRVITGLNEVFYNESRVIILEDDCIPTIDFFKFSEWGLDVFALNNQIGLISGSNLISDKIIENSRNGFSKYINIWGWATWKRTWEKFDPLLTIMEVQDSINQFDFDSKIEKLFWKELFKLSIYSSKIWDFRLQFYFFKYKLFSVYPKRNLIQNVGFGKDATHTSMKIPDYVLRNKINHSISILNDLENFTFSPNHYREKVYIRSLWRYSFINTIKLKIMNIIRFLK